MDQTLVVPAVTAAALGLLLLRLRDPARRTPAAAAVEALSIGLGAVLVGRLLLLGDGWTALAGTTGLTALFGATVASALAMGRAIAAVLATRGWRQVPFDAIVSFAAVSAVAAFLSGVMLVAAFGWPTTGLVAVVAILRTGGQPWRAREVTESWSWEPWRPTVSRR